MGKGRIFHHIATSPEFKSDLANHSPKYCRDKYQLTNRDYTSAVKHLGISPAVIKLHAYTNGVDNQLIPEDLPVPPGYWEGRTVQQRSTAGYVWYHNGYQKTLVSPEDTPPAGWEIGTGGHSTAGQVLYNDGERDFYLTKDAPISADLRRGRYDTSAYKEAMKRRKKYPYNNGESEIHLLQDESVPAGYVPGCLAKLSAAEKIEQRDRYYDSLGYIAVKNLTKKQLTAYQYFRDKTDLITDVIAKADVYTYINKNYISLLDEYAQTNHSKGTSAAEQHLFDFVKSIYPGEIITNCKSVLKDETKHYYEMDIYIPDKHIGIEYNGTYWHCSLNHNKNYHFNKSRIAEKAGIRLIHIYEHEWKDPVKNAVLKSLLRIALGVVQTRIYARNCEIREISNTEAKPFNEVNHLQGHRNAQVTYGLFYENRLVQLMSFSKTKYNRNLKNENDWEIIRGCPGSNNVVVGGVSKLFKHFIRTHHPDSVFSYCDFNKFDGRGYEAIGMKCIGYTGPNKWWVLPGYRVVERNPRRHQEYKKEAVAELYGAGSKKYVYSVS